MAIVDSGSTESSAQEQRQKPGKGLRRWCLVVLALLPALYLLQLIDKYGVDVPYADEFSFTPLLEKAYSGTLTFGDFFQQHNEHRYVFPRLLFIVFAYLSHGDLRAQMFFSAALAAFSALNLWILLRRTVPGSPEKALVLLFLLNVLLFSPVQAENWMWGFQFVLLLANFLFTSALVIATSRLGIGKKFTICVLLAYVATFSFGGGILLWAFTFPFALLVAKELSWKARVLWAAAWGCAGVLAVIIYFYGYVKPSSHPAIAASGNPLDYFLYITTFLGAHLSRASHSEPLFQAALIGFALLAMYGAAVAYAMRRRSQHDLIRRILPWLGLGGYAVVSALLAAAGRIGMGVSQGLDSRYTSFSLYLSVAVIGLAAIVKQEIRSRSRSDRRERLVLRVETVLLTAFAAFSLTAFLWGRASMIETRRTRLLGKGALLFSNVIESGNIHDRYLVANALEARAYANTLNRLGLLHPRMLRSAEISKLPTQKKEAGYLDIISVFGQSCNVRGWAIIPETRAPAHCVVLSYEDPARGMVVFCVADETYVRRDVVAVLKSEAAEGSGWIAHFDRSLVPPGEHMLSAWAVDANRGTLYPLGTPKMLP